MMKWGFRHAYSCYCWMYVLYGWICDGGYVHVEVRGQLWISVIELKLAGLFSKLSHLTNPIFIKIGLRALLAREPKLNKQKLFILK